MRYVAAALLGSLCLIVAGCSGQPGKPAPIVGSSYLEAYLAAGKCKIVVAIWREAVRAPARTYVRANGQPTKACAHPDIVIEVNTDRKLTTGDVLNGRTMVRYDNPAVPEAGGPSA